jgi:DNA-binding MarR family transcriptional regulator
VPKANPAVLQLDRFLPYRIAVLTGAMSQAIATHYADRHGLSIPEWRTLAVLARLPGLSAAEVSARGAMDKVAVSRAVTGLVGRGLLRRRTVARDRRRSSLALTAAGWTTYGEIAPWARDYERTLLMALSASERRALDRALDKLLAAAAPAAPRRTTTRARPRSPARAHP